MNAPAPPSPTLMRMPVHQAVPDAQVKLHKHRQFDGSETGLITSVRGGEAEIALGGDWGGAKAWVEIAHMDLVGPPPTVFASPRVAGASTAEIAGLGGAPDWYTGLVQRIADGIALELRASPVASPKVKANAGDPLTPGETAVIVAAFKEMHTALGVTPNKVVDVSNFNTSLIAIDGDEEFSLVQRLSELGRTPVPGTPTATLEADYVREYKAATPDDGRKPEEIAKEGREKYVSNPARTAGGVVYLNLSWIEQLRPSAETATDPTAGFAYLIMHELIHAHNHKGGECAVCDGLQQAHSADKGDLDEGITDILSRAMADAVNQARVEPAVAAAVGEIHRLTFGDAGGRYDVPVARALQALQDPVVAQLAVRHYFKNEPADETRIPAPPVGPAAAAAAPAAGLDVPLIRAHLATLGVGDQAAHPHPVSVVLVPQTVPNLRPTALRRGPTVSTKMNTAFAEYPAACKFGNVNDADSINSILGRGGGAPAVQMLKADFHGGGYQASHKMVVITSLDSRTLLHELGHYAQDVGSPAVAGGTAGGATEETAFVTVLEYHNVILHENLHPGALRQRYALGGGTPSHTWDELRADVALFPKTVALLDEIEAKLASDPRYGQVVGTRTLAQRIKANLIAEYFRDASADRKGKRASRGLSP